MLQNKLFHDSIFDAIGADVAACGGVKKVACTLWPTLEPTVAAARLRGALNPEHAQKLCPEEVIAIKRLARQHGSTATIDYEARELSFQVAWIDPDDELELIERENNELLKKIARQMERAEQLRTRAQLKVAK